MKAIRFLVLAALTLTVINVHAQTVDEIMAKYTEAMGGKEKLSNLKTVRMSGSMNVQGTDVTLTMTKAQLSGVRLDMEIMGSSNYQVANTKQGWQFMPVMGMASPQEMDEDMLKSFTNQMDIQGPLFNSKEKGYKVELAAGDKADDADAYKLKITFPNGKTAFYFVDKKTNRLVKTSGKTTMQGQEMDVETSFSDYKQNADGYWFPYTVTSAQGPISFDKIETNVAVDPKIFSN